MGLIPGISHYVHANIQSLEKLQLFRLLVPRLLDKGQSAGTDWATKAWAISASNQESGQLRTGQSPDLALAAQRRWRSTRCPQATEQGPGRWEPVPGKASPPPQRAGIQPLSGSSRLAPPPLQDPSLSHTQRQGQQLLSPANVLVPGP